MGAEKTSLPLIVLSSIFLSNSFVRAPLPLDLKDFKDASKAPLKESPLHLLVFPKNSDRVLKESKNLIVFRNGPIGAIWKNQAISSRRASTKND